MAETATPRAPRDPTAAVPYPLRVAGAMCWRFLLLVATLVVLGVIIVRLQVVVVPVAVALLLAALLAPAVGWLARHRVPRGLATGVVLIAGLAAVSAVLTFVIRAFLDGLPDLRAQVGDVIQQLRGWLANRPFGLAPIDLERALDRMADWVTSNQAEITSGALGAAVTVGEFLTGALLALFTLVFFLYDGAGIWRFLLRAVPASTHRRVDVAGRRAFATLSGYTRATAVVAVVDALGIGIGLWAVGVPLVVPLTALVFLGAFVPIVGAVVAGVVAVAVALVAKGIVAALVVLAVVIGVQQLESHLLQPLLLGRAVQLHPLAVVLAVAAGVTLAGITGALLAVPLVAMINSAVRSLSEDDGTVEQDTAPPTDPQHAAPPAPGEADTEPQRPSDTQRRSDTQPPSDTQRHSGTAGSEPAGALGTEGS